MDYSRITDELFIGTTPDVEDYKTLHKLGVSLVINMRIERRPKPNPDHIPIRNLWLPTFDTPVLPIPINALKRGVKAALGAFDNGDKVYVHCAAGKHRGVAMGAAILIAQGYSAEQAMELINQRRPVADPYVWYIRGRIERFARQWNSSHPDTKE